MSFGASTTCVVRSWLHGDPCVDASTAATRAAGAGSVATPDQLVALCAASGWKATAQPEGARVSLGGSRGAFDATVESGASGSVRVSVDLLHDAARTDAALPPSTLAAISHVLLDVNDQHPVRPAVHEPFGRWRAERWLRDRPRRDADGKRTHARARRARGGVRPVRARGCCSVHDRSRGAPRTTDRAVTRLRNHSRSDFWLRKHSGSDLRHVTVMICAAFLLARGGP